MYVGLLLHLHRSECVPVAINANVTSVPKTIAFETPANDNDIYEDVSDLSSRGHKAGSGEKFHQDSEDDFVDNENDNSSDETEKSNDDQSNNGRSEDGKNYSYFLDQFHDQMDWYHVLNAHSNYSKKCCCCCCGRKN